MWWVQSPAPRRSHLWSCARRRRQAGSGVALLNAMKKLLFTLLLAFPLPTHAILLGLPVQCEIGKACFLQNYADHDTGPGIEQV